MPVFVLLDNGGEFVSHEKLRPDQFTSCLHKLSNGQHVKDCIRCRDPNTGLPRAPRVRGSVNARIDTSQGPYAYLRCKQSLDLFLMANGLLNAYRRPGPSELRPMTPRDNNQLNADLRGANSINVPSPAQVAGR